MMANLARAARGTVIVALALLWPAVVAPAAVAADPPIISGRITDIAERLVGEEEGILAALADLRVRRDVTLYIVTLDGIDDEDPGAFVDRIAAANDLGPREAVLFVSFRDRQFGMWTGRDLGVGPERIDDLLVVLGDDLRSGDVAGGMVGAAANLERLMDGLPVIGGVDIPDPTEPMETAPDDEFPVEPGPVEPELPVIETPVPESPDSPAGVVGAIVAVGVVAMALLGLGARAGRGRRAVGGGLITTDPSAAAASRMDDTTASAGPADWSGPSDASSGSSSDGSGHDGGSSSGGSW